MFEIIKNVIMSGGYKLAEIQYKIKKLYVLGDLTEEQSNQLMALASGGASPDAERPETLQMIQTLAAEIAALKERVQDLEGGKNEQPEYPVWKPWDGISKDYQKGDVVSHHGELWESVYEGQNVWEPGLHGTENMWKHPDSSTDDII